MGEGEAYFTKGMEVEVCSDDVGLRGAWFVATVLRSPTKKNKVLVEYHTLMADEKGSKPLREFVDVVNLRPLPPREVDRSFESSDEVDAYLNDGWWEGVVITVLDNSRYSVYFRPGKEELEFEQSELRIHREWVKGSWVPPMEEVQQSGQEQQQQAKTQNADTENNQGNVKSDKAGLLPVDNAADIANEFNSEKLKIVQPISTSSMTQILAPCINPKQGQTSQGPLFLGAQHEEIFHSFPTSNAEAAPQNKNGLCQNLIKNFPSPFQRLSDLAGKGGEGPPMKEPGQNLVDILSNPAEQFLPDFAQVKIGCVLDCGRADDQTLEYLPSLSNNEGEKCDLSKTMTTSPTTKEEEAPLNKKQHCQNSTDNFSSRFGGLNGHLTTKGEENPPEKREQSQYLTDVLSGSSEGFSNEPIVGQEKSGYLTTKGEENSPEKKEQSQNLTDVLSGPSEGFSNEPIVGQEKSGSVLDCERSVHQTVEDLSPLSNKEEEKVDIYKAMASSPTIKEEEAALQNKTELCQTLTDNFSSPFEEFNNQLEEFNNQLARKGEETFDKKEPSDVLSSRSEGLSIYLVPNCGQEKIGSVLKYDCSSHPVVEDLSAFSNTGEKCVSPKARTTSPSTKEAATLKNKKDPSQYLTCNFSSPLEELSDHYAPKGEEASLQKNIPSQNLGDIFSSPSKGLSNQLEPSLGQEKFGIVLDCNRSGHPTVEDLSPFANYKGEKSDLSKAMSTTSSTTKVEIPPAEKKGESQSLTDIFSSPLGGLSSQHSGNEGEASLPEKKVLTQNLNDIFSSPSEGRNNHLTTSFVQEKSESIFGNESCGCHQTVEDISISPLSNQNGKQCDSSTILVECSKKNIDFQVNIPDQQQCPIFSSPLGGLSSQHSANEGEVSLPEKKGLTQNLNDISSSPSEVWNNHLTTSFVQEKSESIFGNESCGCHQTVENISISPLSNQNGKQCDLSTTLVECSKKNIDVQVNIPDQQQWGPMEIERCCPDMASDGKTFCKEHGLEQNIHNEQRRKRPREASHIIMEPFIPSEHQQQCRRTGKGWRCSKLASPWKRYCDRHEEEQNIRNGKRRKKPVEQNQFIMEPFLPSENLQCRRTGKGWRCSAMASTGKRYCGKHQLEQDTYNEKRRNMARELRCLATSGTNEKSNFDNMHLELSERQQCDPVDMDLESNQGEAGIDADQGLLLQVDKSAVSDETVNESDMGKTKVEAYYDDFWSLFIT